jgi:hypothetical protein
VVNLADSDSIFKFQHVEKVVNNNTGSGAIYCLGIFGAAIYFLQRAGSFWEVIWGLIQAVFWPAVVVYEGLKLLNL